MTRISAILIFFSFLLIPLSSPAGADPLAGFDMDIEEPVEKSYSFGGYLEYSARYAYGREDFLRNRQKLFAEGEYSKDKFKVYAAVYGINDFAPEDWNGDEQRFKLHEGYVRYDGERWDFSAGKRMLRWGTSDGINPIDLINPRDHLNPVAGARSDSRLSVWLLSSVYTGDNFTFELVGIPKAAVNKLPEEGSPWEPDSLSKIRGSREIAGEDEPESAEVAARIYTTLKGWDLSLLYFNGYEDNPTFEMRDRLTPVYKELKAYGFNFAKGMSRSTFRGELVMKNSDIYDDGYLIAVFGFDHNFDDEEYLNIQLFSDNADDEMQGITYELSDKYFDGEVKLGIRGMHYFNDDSGSSEIYSEILYGDSLTFKLGVMAAYGDESSSYGQFDSNDYSYAEIKYSF